MRLAQLRWILAIAALLACLVAVWAVSAAETDSSAAWVQEKTVQEEFRLSVDERGLRGAWRSGEENGSLRIDLNENGLKIHGRGTTRAEGESRRRCPTCGCDCRQ